MSATSVVFGSGAAAKQLGIERWKMLYLIEKRKLPDASLSVAGRRLFTTGDLDRMACALAQLESEESYELAQSA